MPRRRKLKGEMEQYERPDWLPLLYALADPALTDFMWMNDVRLSDGRLIQAYKHRDTRRYVFLGGEGRPFGCENRSPDDLSGPADFRYFEVDLQPAMSGALHGLYRSYGPHEEKSKATFELIERCDYWDRLRERE